MALKDPKHVILLRMLICSGHTLSYLLSRLVGDQIGTLLMMNELEFFAICPVKKVSVWSDYTVHWIFLFSSTNLKIHKSIKYHQISPHSTYVAIIFS